MKTIEEQIEEEVLAQAKAETALTVLKGKDLVADRAHTRLVRKWWAGLGMATLIGLMVSATVLGVTELSRETREDPCYSKTVEEILKPGSDFNNDLSVECGHPDHVLIRAEETIKAPGVLKDDLYLRVRITCSCSLPSSGGGDAPK